MSVEISENHRNFLEEIASKQGYKSYTITLNKSSTRGENYLGIIIYVKITEISNGKTLNIMLKAAPQSYILREKIPIEKAYDRELYLYSVVFREFSDLLQLFDVAQIHEISPKFYGGSLEPKDECLVLENLSENGFKLWNRKKAMDTQHVGVAMRQYGKLHGMSHALKILRPEKYAEIAGKLTDIFEGKWTMEEWKNSLVLLKDCVNKAIEENQESKEILENFFESVENDFQTISNVKDKFSVILHVDCWCNNMMFKYEENSSKPSKIHLIDWQLSKIGNPVMDITYFFYACSSKTSLDAHTKFLKIYHESLTETLSLFGLHSIDVITYEELEEQWLIYAKFGIYRAFMVIKVMLSEEEETKDLDELLESGKNIMDMFNIDISRIDEYNERIRIIVNHMLENGLI